MVPASWLAPLRTVYFEEARRLGSSRPLFREPGVYPIYCELHPDRIRGTITARRDLPPLKSKSGE